MNKNVYLVTFHNALNYGAVLQCVALYKAINRMANCQIIDYRSPAIERRYKIFRKGAPFKDILKSALLLNNTRKKRRQFEEFILGNASLTGKYNCYDELCKEHWKKTDIFIVGSDQVWNFDITHNDPAFFLDFAPTVSKCVSYAASLGKEVDDRLVLALNDKERSISSVSIREQSAVDKLSSLGITCQQNIDPVFLLTREEWARISKSSEVELNKKYVLIYALQKSKKLIENAFEYANQNNLDVIMISTGLRRDYNCEYVSNCSPEEFVRLFFKATAIFTNSFHGIAFSIVANNTFFYELQGIEKGKESRNSRLNDLITMFGLQDRNLNAIKKIDDCEKIDYSTINNIIDDERKKSFEYLKRVICE
ncbi:polysaccharide pyruvyl transferase family protein [Butyrivibrio sp. FC2001]|uniref:polysaccharide pyruvyl transferase family protein n=1 Tax=Butyrivibrio sp. FC2001 TaxID=1280671 RepID=UPI00041D701C|nr:polysaccharide pyruvyl transferase family protein [Butyrivibrio sp. FC2001]